MTQMNFYGDKYFETIALPGGSIAVRARWHKVEDVKPEFVKISKGPVGEMETSLPVLLFDPNLPDKQHVIATWNHAHWPSLTGILEHDYYWIECASDSIVDKETFEPTHWMYIPKEGYSLGYNGG